MFAVPATDPSADGAVVAFQEPGAGGMIARPGGAASAAPGPHPAVGGGLVAWIGDGTVEVRSQADPAVPVFTLPAAADAVAVSAGWVAWRADDGGRDALFASPLPPAAPAPRLVARAGPGATLGRPSLAGERLLFHVAGTSSSRIDEILLASDRRSTLRTAPRALLLNPSSDGQPAALRALDLPAPAAADRAAEAPRRCATTARSTAPSRPAAATRATSRASSTTQHGHPAEAPAAAAAQRLADALEHRARAPSPRS